MSKRVKHFDHTFVNTTKKNQTQTLNRWKCAIEDQPHVKITCTIYIYIYSSP